MKQSPFKNKFKKQLEKKQWKNLWGEDQAGSGFPRCWQCSEFTQKKQRDHLQWSVTDHKVVHKHRGVQRHKGRLGSPSFFQDCSKTHSVRQWNSYPWELTEKGRPVGYGIPDVQEKNTVMRGSGFRRGSASELANQGTRTSQPATQVSKRSGDQPRHPSARVYVSVTFLGPRLSLWVEA